MLLFDYLVLGILIVLSIRGAMKGLVAQIASIASVLVGWIVAARCHAAISPAIPVEVPWNRYAAMLILFVGVWIGVRMCGGMISGWLRAVNVKEFDRQLGFLIGLLKGLLVCMVLTFFGVSLSEWTREPVLSSKSGHYLSLAIVKTGALIPNDLCKRLHAQIDTFHAKLDAEQGGAPIQEAVAGGRGGGATETVMNTETEKISENSLWKSIASLFGSSVPASTEPAGETQPLIDKIDKGLTVVNELDKLFNTRQPTPTTTPTPSEVPFIPSSNSIPNTVSELPLPSSQQPSYGSIGVQPFTPISAPQHTGAAFDPQTWGQSFK